MDLSGDFVTIDVVEKKNQKIRIVGTYEDPYFCGRDVCAILEYKDINKTLREQVKETHKKDLKSFSNELEDVTSSNSLGSNNLKNLTYHSGKAVYISEAGLYSLIMRSKVPFAEAFQDLVFEVILPSIRKHGKFQMEQRLSTTMEQLKLETAAKEKAEREKELEKVAKEKAEHEKELEKVAKEKAERKALRINKFMKQITVKEHKLEWIYIATTSMYASERIFKIGSTTRLSTRIGGYNTGRPIEDGYYYCWVVKCYNAKDVDYCIQKLLADFKHRETTELYCGIRFTDLRDIVAFIVENYDASVDYINNFIKFKLSQSLDQEDEEPPRLDCKRITCHIGEHTETINLENEDLDTLELIKLEISSMLTDMQQRQVALVVDRKVLLERLEKKIASEPRKNLWTRVKEFTGWTTSKAELSNGDLNYKIVY
jgi:prophage antirepressor-like protein